MPNPNRDAAITAVRKAGAVKLTIHIRPGPASVTQKQAWKRFWQKLIAEVKDDQQ